MTFVKRAGILLLTVGSLVFFQNCGESVDMSQYTQASESTDDAADTTDPVVIAPAITDKTADLSISVGTAVGLSVVATGDDLTYAWAKNGVEIVGATSSLLTISNAQLTDAGQYAVYVTNTVGQVSTAINLSVNSVVDTSPPTILKSPADIACIQTKAVVSPNQMTLSVSTAKATSFQWYFMKKGTTTFVALSGQTTAQYRGPITSFDFGTYRLRVSNAYGVVNDDTLVYVK